MSLVALGLVALSLVPSGLVALGLLVWGLIALGLVACLFACLLFNSSVYKFVLIDSNYTTQASWRARWRCSKATQTSAVPRPTGSASPCTGWGCAGCEEIISASLGVVCSYPTCFHVHLFRNKLPGVSLEGSPSLYTRWWQTKVWLCRALRTPPGPEGPLLVHS